MNKQCNLTITSYTLSSYCDAILTSVIELCPHDSTHGSDYSPMVQTGQRKRKEIAEAARGHKDSNWQLQIQVLLTTNRML